MKQNGVNTEPKQLKRYTYSIYMGFLYPVNTRENSVTSVGIFWVALFGVYPAAIA